MDEVKQLKMLGFSRVRIADMLHISRSTLYRRLDSSDLAEYTDISDRELDSLIQTYKVTHPNDRESMVIGHLRSCEVRVPRSRVRDSIHRIDPRGIIQRSLTTIRRRVYHVEAPNKVWHMDGNHKMIRWKFVIHGGIDGYSRVIVFLHCSVNNLAESVLGLFISAVATHGLPMKVRTDGGGENVDVWEYMIHRRGDAGVIVGSSVHNVRIERLWRDVRRAVLDPFRDTFSRLEEEFWTATMMRTCFVYIKSLPVASILHC